MKRFEWNPSLECGEPTIDSQHRKLMELASKFNEEILNGGDPGLSMKLIENLANYAISHFQHEEKFYERQQFAGLERHIQLHEDLKKKLALRILSAKKGQVPMKADMSIFVHDWIVHHIMEEDLRAIRNCRNLPE